MASTLRIEPMRFATGQALEFSAGDTLPETTASVLNGGGQRITKLPFTGERLVVTQRLWRLPPEGAVPAGGGEEQDEGGGGGRATKRQRKGRKGRGRQDENAADNAAKAGGSGESAAPAAGLPAGAELLLELENKTPVKDTFQFARITDGLQCSGRYALEFVAAPAAAGQLPLRALVQLAVVPGPPCSFDVSGEGKAVTALKDIALGACSVVCGWCVGWLRCLGRHHC